MNSGRSAESIDISGAADWSRDGQWIVTGGTDTTASGDFQNSGRRRPARPAHHRPGIEPRVVAGRRPDRICRRERGLLRPPFGRERTNSGLARAKAEGKHLGRKPSLSEADQQTVQVKLAAGESVSALSREFKRPARQLCEFAGQLREYQQQGPA